MKNKLFGFFALTLSVASPLLADTSLSASWVGGSRPIALPDIGTQQIQLSIICSEKNGYNVTFSTPNALTTSTANMKLAGEGTTTETQIPYSVTMDLSQFTSTAQVTTNSIRLTGGQPSVSVNFNGAGNIKPENAAKANIIKLNIGISSYASEEKKAGTYSDRITAVVDFR